MNLVILALIVWALIPMGLLLSRSEVPFQHRLKGCGSFVAASIGGYIIVPFVLLAPFVVPVALLYTKREDDTLPWWARPWDNDVSINGDRPEYWAADYTGTTYYANAHPRSYWARFVWLVLRNRASWLARELGHTWRKQTDRLSWGDPATGRDHEGWQVNYCDGAYQIYLCRRVGSKLVFRLNYGYKVWPQHDGRPICNVVNITGSLLRWKGAA